MSRNITNYMRAPYAVPNGLQVTDDGLWIVDQLTDRMVLVEIAEPNEYGVTKILHEIPTESSTTSGVSYGEDSLWLSANGPGEHWRPARPTDARTGEILRVDPQTGATISRCLVPGGGGTHGLEYDRYDPGTIWLSTLHDRTLTKVYTNDWSIKHVIPLPHDGGHGIVRVEDGLWMVFKQSRVICKLDVNDGHVLDQIDIGAEYPEPHGLTSLGEDLLYCDATSGWIVRVEKA